MVNRRDIRQNGMTIRDRPLTNGHRYVVDLTVRTEDGAAEIVVTLDGEDYLQYRGSENSLSIAGNNLYEIPNPKNFALGAFNGPITFHSVKVFRAAR